MNIKELRALTPKELDEKIAELKQRQFELRRRSAVGQIEHPDDLHFIRKDIAKAETVRRERQLQIKVPETK